VWVADAMQVTLGDGPSLEPMWVADYVTVDDLSTDQRWAQWAPSVGKLGLRSLISRLRDGDGHPKPGQHGPGSDEVSVRI